MPAPVIVLPQQFKGTTLSVVAADVVSHVDGEGTWPEAMTCILQRLGCRELTVEEIIASLRRGRCDASLLELRYEYPPKARRDFVYLTNLRGYVASL